MQLAAGLPCPVGGWADALLYAYPFNIFISFFLFEEGKSGESKFYLINFSHFSLEVEGHIIGEADAAAWLPAA